MANHLVVERVARLNAVDDLAFLLVAHPWHHRHGFVEIDVEILSVGFDFANAESLECLLKLLENQVHTVFDGLRVVGVGVGQGALEVVKHGQDGRHGFLAAVQNQLGLLLERAFLVVFKLGDGA